MKKRQLILPATTILLTLASTSDLNKSYREIFRNQTLISATDSNQIELSKLVRREDIKWHYWSDGGASGCVGDVNIDGKGETDLDAFLRKELKYKDFKGIEYYKILFDKYSQRMISGLEYGDIKFVSSGNPYAVNVTEIKYEITNYTPKIELELELFFHHNLISTKPSSRDINAQFKDGDKTYFFSMDFSHNLSKNYFYFSGGIGEKLDTDKSIVVSRDYHSAQDEQGQSIPKEEKFEYYYRLSNFKFAPYSSDHITLWDTLSPPTVDDIKMCESLYHNLLKRLEKIR